MNELFVLIIAHCSGGHGDTFSLKGVYFHFATALCIARSIEEDKLNMHGSDHGAIIFKVGLNKTYNVREVDHVVYMRRFPFYGDDPWTEEWYDEELKRIHGR